MEIRDEGDSLVKALTRRAKELLGKKKHKCDDQT
ncbi:uncharacterized protein G2W53_029402 [Senna tora]|uniref:Uncharacterized protein n=1 Tax=Senna tora TaxID=362788 RepID=A0A834WBT3_9FABA|nr:uncharacterized protein G2W53_029402 [Senna tora]